MIEKITVFVLIALLLTGGILPTSAYWSDVSTSENFGYVIENGIARKIRFVTAEEHHNDTSSNFSIIDARKNDDYSSFTSLAASPLNIANEIKLMIAGAVAGILTNEVWIFIGGSNITQAMFAKAVTAYNKNLCILSGGNPYTGPWMCPMKL